MTCWPHPVVLSASLLQGNTWTGKPKGNHQVGLKRNTCLVGKGLKGTRLIVLPVPPPPPLWENRVGTWVSMLIIQASQVVSGIHVHTHLLNPLAPKMTEKVYRFIIRLWLVVNNPLLCWAHTALKEMFNYQLLISTVGCELRHLCSNCLDWCFE